MKKSAGPCPTSPIRRRSADPRINLKSNELIHPAADEVVRMVTRGAVPADFRRYPATAEVAAALAEYFGRDSSECVITPGSDIAIHLICDAYARSGGGSRMLLLQSPNYDAWEIAGCVNGLRIRAFSAPDGDTASQGHQLLIAAEQERGALIALSSPNGPAGGRTPDHLLDALARVSSLRDHLFVIDSCYQAFDGALNHHVRHIDGGALVVQTLSKSHGLAGARVSLLFGDPERLGSLCATRLEHAVAGTSLLAARGVIAHHDKLREIWEEIREVREEMSDQLRGWGLRPLPSMGNFLTVRVGDPGRATSLTDLLAQQNYRVRDLSDLAGLEGCIRFTVGDVGTMKAFLPCFERALAARGMA